MPDKKPIYAVEAKRIDGSSASLSEYAGKVLLIVNVASKCGLTPQYDGLEKLYAEHKNDGLAVLGFPANNFAGQEPGSNEEIAEFCRATYGVDFPMFAKVSVAGSDQAPLYKLLTETAPKRTLTESPRPGAAQKAADSAVRWNFEKFLVSRNGDIVARFDPDVTPDNPILVKAVERELAR